MSRSDLDYLVSRWREWGDPVQLREKFQPALATDDLLLALLEKFVRTGRKYSGNLATDTYSLSMSSLAAVVDLEIEEPRVRSLQSRSGLTVRQTAALNRYLKGLQRIREGKSPDDFFVEDAIG